MPTSSAADETGKVSGVRVHLLLAFHPDNEALAGLNEFVREHGVSCAHFTAIGALSRATLAWYDVPRKTYREIRVDEPVEVVSCIGDVARDQDDSPIVHVHCAVSDRTGKVTGGHLLEGPVSATLEVFLTEEPTTIRKVLDDRLGLKLIEWLAPLALAIVAVALLLLTQLDATSPTSAIAWRLALAGAGLGLFQAPNTSALISAAPASEQGMASGVFATACITGQALSVAVVGAVFAGLGGAAAGSAQAGTPASDPGRPALEAHSCTASTRRSPRAPDSRHLAHSQRSCVDRSGATASQHGRPAGYARLTCRHDASTAPGDFAQRTMMGFFF